MLTALVFGVLLAGASAQLMPVQQGGDICRGQTNNAPYAFCGYFPSAQLNIYWTYVPQGEDVPQAQVNILIEGVDDAWRAFGFANQRSPAMAGSRVVFGCQDIQPDTQVLDTLLPDRTLPGVEGGLGMGGQNLMNVDQSRMDGLCGIRFERLAVNNNEATQDIVEGTPNAVVAAFGRPNDELRIHDGREAAVIDFIGGMADGLMEIVMLEPPTMEPTNPDNSAAAFSLSSVVVAGVASVLAAL